MQVVYTNEDMPQSFTKSIFLAGPSLRPGQEEHMESWRKDAIRVLQDMGFEGTIFCPENRDGKFEKDFSYDNQVEWEDKYLNVADCIVFWVPRDLKELPAFTTNIEWGTWADSGKVVLGAPPDAEKMDYIKYYAKEYKVPVSDTLTATLKHALDKLGDGAERSGGERYVPLFIWQLNSFQQWYKAQVHAENVLEDARLLYSFRPGYKDFVFLWVLKVNVYISSEDRYKSNEFVLSRPNISSVCLWCDTNEDSILDTQVVLVREYRSPAATPDGFIYELPSGSSHKGGASPETTAAEELHEETGMWIEPDRLKLVDSRQLAGTLSAHKSTLYSVSITGKELEWFRSQEDIPHGVEEDSERTFIEVKTLREVISAELVDWSTVGMIFSAFYKN